MTFKEVDPQPDYIQNEEDRLSWWKEEGVVEKYLHKNDASDKNFRFLDGPITANNPMGVHHAHGRTIKDFYQRYKNMQGFKQRFQNGFDCQGLWVEVEEEKDLGFDSKRDIEEYGIDKFCQSCRARVDRFSKVQAEQSQRLGMFMDWDNSYYTMSERNNLHIWYFLKKVHEKGWLYKGVDAMPWCTRCGTAISQHELSDGGYKDVTHESVYVKFKLKNAENTYLLIWTTTPWTLLSNVAVAVDPNLQYREWELENGSHMIVVQEDQIDDADSKKIFEDKVLSKTVKSVKDWTGQELIGTFRHYEGPFDTLPAVEAARVRNPETFHSIIPAPDLVNANEGTGLVHIAPGAGKEDFELGKEMDLPVIESIDDFGVYLDGFGDFTGESVFDARGDIYTALGDKLIEKRTIFHSYPHCWRCKHELVFKTTAEWFIKADEIRPLMKKAANEVNWMPDHARKRMQDWLDNMSDWPISRKRYWGLALPIYENEDRSKFYVVESKDELRALAVEPEKVDTLPELHRPWIDEIVLDGSKISINGEKQSGQWTRVKDVGDCWLDAGIVPFSTVDYLTNKEYWEEWYPFDFITEYIAQVKLWFYATLFMSVTLMDSAPWKNVLATGFLVDEQGKHMHKSAGNAIAFDDAAAKAGADPIRWLYLRERAANYHGTGNFRFGYTILDEVRRRYLNILWNTYRYFVTHANAQNWEPSNKQQSRLLARQAVNSKQRNVLDTWILARLHSVVTQAETYLDAFDSPDAASLLEEFVVKDFSQWYVRRSRDRVNVVDSDTADRDAFFATTYFVLKTLTKVLAPFIPYLAEEMYQNLRTDNDPLSVHVEDWPHLDDLLQNNELVEEMQSAREIVERAHALRKEACVRLRQPLQTLELINSPKKFSDPIMSIILDELNIKEVTYKKNEDTEEFEVGLDLDLTPELVAEGTAREIVREVQNLRRQAGYAFDQEVVLYWETSDERIESVFTQFKNDIESKTVSTALMGAADTADASSELETEIGTVSLAVYKQE